MKQTADSSQEKPRGLVDGLLPAGKSLWCDRALSSQFPIRTLPLEVLL